MQLEVPDSAGRSTGVRWILALTVVAMICGGALRLVALDEVGLKGSDNTYYTSMALLWSEGDHAYNIGDGPALYHRPVAYWVYAQTIRLLGFNDTSIKIANASLDTINILLVFLLAFILSRKDLWAAASAATIYALLPFTILISRSELTHTLSTSMVLVATIFLSLAWYAENRGTRLILVFISGVATGLSALTHEEMIFTAAGPSFLLLLLPWNRGNGARSRLISAASYAGSYLFGVLVVAHGMLQTHQVDAQGRASEIIVHRISQSQYLGYVNRPLRYAWNALTGSSSTVLACLVIFLVIVLITRFAFCLVRRKPIWSLPTPPIVDLPLWTVAAHLFVYSFFFTYYAVRLFVPLVPLVVVWLVVRSASLSTQYAGRRATNVFLSILTVAVVTANIGHIATLRDSMSSYFTTWVPFSLADDMRPGTGWSILQKERTRTGWAKRRYEELGNVVTSDSRLLVGASAFHPFRGRRSLQIGYYFSDNAVYLVDHDQPFDQLIEEKEIGFVLFTSYQTEDWSRIRGLEFRRYLYDGRWGPPEHITPGESLGLADGEYTIAGEFERLRASLTQRGARIILGRRDLLQRMPSGTDPSSYVVWVLDPKSWPPLENEIEVTSRSLELASHGRLSEALASLDAADTTGFHDMGHFRLQIAATRILAEHDHPEKARRRVAEAMSVLPRNTTVSTALRDAYPTQAATAEVYRQFADLQAIKPRNRPLRDLLLALAVNLTEFAIEEDDRAGSIDAFEKIDQQLQNPGSRKFTVAITEWCTPMCRDLARDGRMAEADACLAAASAADR
jgi:4-amino-4-deoxy-L-arabinose transferase-like glycosyltransferase